MYSYIYAISSLQLFRRAPLSQLQQPTQKSFPPSLRVTLWLFRNETVFFDISLTVWSVSTRRLAPLTPCLPIDWGIFFCHTWRLFSRSDHRSVMLSWSAWTMHDFWHNQRLFSRYWPNQLDPCMISDTHGGSSPGIDLINLIHAWFHLLIITLSTDSSCLLD